MWILNPGKITKVLRLLQILLCYLAHTSLLLVFAVYVAYCPYVSMGIAALWVNYRQLNNLKISVDDDNCKAHMMISVLLSRVRMQLSCIPFVTFIKFNDEQ